MRDFEAECLGGLQIDHQLELAENGKNRLRKTTRPARHSCRYLKHRAAGPRAGPSRARAPQIETVAALELIRPRLLDQRALEMNQDESRRRLFVELTRWYGLIQRCRISLVVGPERRESPSSGEFTPRIDRPSSLAA